MRHDGIAIGARVLAGVLACLWMAGPVRAFEVNHANTVADVVANSLIVNGDGGDWNSAVLLVELTSGSVYNDPVFDGMTPNSLFWSAFPDTEFDSWVGIPGDGTGSILGAAGDFGDFGPAVIEGQKVSVTWFNTDLTDTTPVRIANISLTDDAVGTWAVLVGFSGGVILSEAGYVIDGVMGLTGPPLVGDLNGDGFVGIDDLNMILIAWNQSVPPANAQADPSGDGFVGIDDLNIVLGNWNAGPPQPAQSNVPEPATLALFAAAALPVLRRRWAD